MYTLSLYIYIERLESEDGWCEWGCVNLAARARKSLRKWKQLRWVAVTHVDGGVGRVNWEDFGGRKVVAKVKVKQRE